MANKKGDTVIGDLKKCGRTILADDPHDRNVGYVVECLLPRGHKVDHRALIPTGYVSIEWKTPPRKPRA